MLLCACVLQTSVKVLPGLCKVMLLFWDFRFLPCLCSQKFVPHLFILTEFVQHKSRNTCSLFSFMCLAKHEHIFRAAKEAKEGKLKNNNENYFNKCF